jgi:hypothetical protein
MKVYLLERLYPRVLDGLPGLGTPESFADRFRDEEGSLRERAERLTRAHVALSGTAGFLSGLGGWLVLPIVLPANLASVALIQLHMAASIASLAGSDPHDELTRRQVFGCLIGDTAVSDARTEEEETFDRVGLKLAERGLNFVISNAARGAKWATEKAATGFVKRRLTRGIPVLGGIIGAVSDSYVTNAVADSAIEAFVDGRGGDGGGSPGGDGLPSNVGDLPEVTRPTTDA